MKPTVEIPRKVFVGLAGVALIGVLGLAFMLGRESGRTRPGPARGGRGADLDPGAPAARDMPPPGAAAAQPGTPFPETSTPPGAPAGQPAAAGTPPPQAQPTRGSEAEASARGPVAAYFRAVENLQPGALGDPEAMAQQVVEGLAKGDTSGLDAMIQRAQAARTRMAGLAPPAPCAEYHRSSLASLDEGLEVMRAMKASLSGGGDSSQLTALAERANGLKARSEAVQRMEQALKQRFGVGQ